MKKEFSTAWKASSQPRKQRKFLAKAPLHIKRRQLNANLTKNLREKYGRNLPVKKGDKVKIMRGKYKGKSGKITKVIVKRLKIYIEGIQTTKQDGSKIEVPIRSSNLQITELNLEDKKRIKTKVETPKKEIKPLIKEKKK
ncbi:MAG: 50S ribosomal protein L24 [Nanoarchaeota archaeon]|nr:50S ribosomal protein L24 [Nanoarchaeota archaeon]